MKARASLLDMVIGSVFAAATLGTAGVMVKVVFSPEVESTSRALAGLAAVVLFGFGAVLSSVLIVGVMNIVAAHHERMAVLDAIGWLIEGQAAEDEDADPSPTTKDTDR